jgi:hypothetical protein
VIPLFSIAYLPPISYIYECIRSGKIILDQHEHYIKQTYRNRTNIYGANGLLPLIIPVQHKNLFRVPVKDVNISYAMPWQKIHWRSITSAYRNSPFFEYYEDEFATFYEKKFDTLFEFNLELLKRIFFLMKEDVEISFTTSYEKQYADIQDLRNTFSAERRPKQPEIYRQVFSERFGFLSDLSIIDKLFNVRM